jgi:GTPase SAR1 family protein
VIKDVGTVSTEQISHMFKLVALGDGAVGKTSCIKQYTEGSFSERYIATIGTTFALKTVDVTMPDGNRVTARVVLWDLAGQPTYIWQAQLWLSLSMTSRDPKRFLT